MSKQFPFSTKEIYLIRHGETAWTLSGQHTGRTDIPLTEHGKKQAESIAKAIKPIHFDKVFSSPLQRALNTCQLSLTHEPIIDPDLLEWDYGKYEGMTSSEIKKMDPSWLLFRDGCPEGESLSDITTRADRFLKKLSDYHTVAIFSSGHFSRALIARYLGLPVSAGHYFCISPASITILGTEHNQPVLISSNTLCHLK